MKINVKKLSEFNGCAVQIIPLSNNQLFIRNVFFIIGKNNRPNVFSCREFSCRDIDLERKLKTYIFKNKSNFVSPITYHVKYHCIVKLNNGEKFITYFGKKIYDKIVEAVNEDEFNINKDKVLISVVIKKITQGSLEYDDYSSSFVYVTNGIVENEKSEVFSMNNRDIASNIDYLINTREPNIIELASIIREHKINTVVDEESCL